MNTVQSPHGDIEAFSERITNALPRVDPLIDPFQCLVDLPEIPRFDFFVQTKKSGDRVKRRLIGNPNAGMRKLHKNFQHFVMAHCAVTRVRELTAFRSATAFTPGSSPLANARWHSSGEHFYLVDLAHAYDTLDTNILTMLLVAIVRFDEYFLEWQSFTHALKYGIRIEEETLHRTQDDPLMPRMQAFINTFVRGPHGHGIITGAPSSPYLFNLYCEVMLDAPLRYICRPFRTVYRRYADDLTFSGLKPNWSDTRRTIRDRITKAGFEVNHRKSHVLCRTLGPAFITGFGVGSGGRIIYPGKKRRRLKGMLLTALRRGEGDSSVIAGHIAAFEEYVRVVQQTASDRGLMRLIAQWRSQHSLVPY